jgi:TatD DNase family protein
LEVLRERLIRADACVGEIGLDRWLREDNIEDQQEVFLAQLRLATEADLPVTIHCLKAWGRLYDILRTERLPARGFLLHSFGGPREMVKPLARLGAYFSFPGYFAHARKERQRAAFLEVPPDRLLLETDAPDQVPPANLDPFGLKDPSTLKPINHPANLLGVYEYLAGFMGWSMGDLEAQIEANFKRLFER